jgi:hypothetical protein
MTLEEFLTRDCKVTDSAGIPLEAFLSSPELLVEPGWYEGKEVELPSHSDFATAPLKRKGWPETDAYQMLLQRKGDGWKPVGLYIDDTIVLAEPVRGQGLSTELILRCVPHRDLPQRRDLTRAGCAALTRAYYVGVGKAIADRREVADHIRQAYEEWWATRSQVQD